MVDGTARIPSARVEEFQPLPALIALLVATLAAAVILFAFEPIVAVAALAAVGVAAVCIVRLDLAVLLVVASVPLEAAVEISPNPQLSVTKLLGAVMFVSFVVNTLGSRRRLWFDRSHALVLALLALALVSTVQARDVNPALATTVRYASFVGLYIVVSQFVGDRLFQRRLVWVLSLASAVAAAIALYRFLWGGELNASLPHTSANDTAFILATTLPLTFWLLRGRLVTRLLVLSMIAVMLAAVVLSFSRGALVGLGAAFVWQIFTGRKHIPVLLLGAVLAGIAAAALVQVNPSQVELGFRGKQSVAESNVSIRLVAWEAAIELMGEHPIGIGPGNFGSYFHETTGRPPGTASLALVHNAYLDVGAELGAVAMLVFLGYVGVVFVRMNEARRRRIGPQDYASALQTSFVVALAAAVFLSEQYFAPFWLLGALGTVLWAERGLGPVPGPPPEEPQVPHYDLRVGEPSVDQRERRLRAHVASLRLEEKRLAALRAELEARAEELREREAALGDVESLREAAADLEERQRELARREEEYRARAEAEPPLLPAVARPGDELRRWRLDDLEDLLARHGREFPERLDEWHFTLLYLGDYTDVDGVLSADFDHLVWDVFGDLLEREGRTP